MSKLTNARPGSYFDNGSIQHLSHVLLDLEQFYLNGRDPDEGDVHGWSEVEPDYVAARRYVDEVLMGE